MVVVVVTACSIICFSHFFPSQVCCCCKEKQQQQQQQENEYEDVGETNIRPTISAPLAISTPLAEQSVAPWLTPPPPAPPSRMPEQLPSGMPEHSQQEDGARGMPSMDSFVLRKKIDLHTQSGSLLHSL